jgi:DNA-binding LacI/PurR family transcriptional regulator
MLSDHGLVDGVILIGRHSANLLELFEHAVLPWVLLGNNYDGDLRQFPSSVLSYNDEAGSYEAASYLVRLGHREIAFVGNVALPWFKRRRAGYQRAASRHKFRTIEIAEDWDLSGVEYGRLAAAELLRREAPPTAIFAANDEVAAGVWKELIHREIRVPREMSLCGFGDRQEFQILEPSLTTIAVFPEKLGTELARMLLARIEAPNRSVESQEYPCRLVERNSCDRPPARLQAVNR